MSTVTVRSTIGGLTRDLERMSKEAPVKLNDVVRDGVKAGNIVAKDFARRSAGRHGRRYPSSFTTSMNRPTHLIGASTYSGEYGPDASRPQGNMSFEWGSRNQKPHMDLNRSADLVGPILSREVLGVVDRLFW